jgi:hypothetical protein
MTWHNLLNQNENDIRAPLEAAAGCSIFCSMLFDLFDCVDLFKMVMLLFSLLFLLKFYTKYTIYDEQS